MSPDDPALPISLPGAEPRKPAAKPAAKKRTTGRKEPAASRPVARVCVDVSLPHLDRTFDYQVLADQDGAAVPGCRVRVRFGGQLVGGFLLERADDTQHTGTLAPLARVVSAEPVLSDEIARLARVVADRYAGTLADVLRLAVPPRHARAERAEPPAGPSADPVPVPSADGWVAYPAGASYLRALAEGRSPRAVFTAAPGEDWPARLAEAMAATLAGGRGAVAVLPDGRDLDRLDAALRALLGDGRHVMLSAAQGPEQRYRRFLAASRGRVNLVIGTRAAMFAPVRDPGLMVLWDDGDDVLAEQRAPYPHAREVLLTRAGLSGAGVLLGGFGRTAEAELLVGTGWAREIVPDREALRARAPRVRPTVDDIELDRHGPAALARLPTVAWEAARAGLAAGAPVLIQVPRRGYLPSVSCARCRQRAQCPHCSGPLQLPSAGGFPVCRWCGRAAAPYACPRCGSGALRAAVIGDRRTAEELGRAFPGTTVRTSGRDGVLATVAAEPALVVATPGAEPVAERGYGAVLLLDSWALLSRADMRAAEETLRRWLAAAVLARPAVDGGQVVVVADAALPTVQALVRFDPAGHARRELAERRELGFPPAVRMASLTGKPAAVEALLAAAHLPDGTDTLGPVPVGPPSDDADDTQRLLLRVNRARGPALAAALHAAAGVRSARKDADPVRIQVDPLDLL